MRLRPEKIQQLSEKILEALEEHEAVQLNAEKENIISAIRQTLLQDLRAEEALDEEVEQVLEANKRLIQGKNIDLSAFRRKVKKQLAREQGLVL